MHMQTSMGQAASTLSSLLDMPSEVTDGDREKNLEKSLLQARKELTDAVSSAGDHGPAVSKLLHLQCPIALKYAQLSVGQMLKENCESVLQIKTIPQALGILEKYGRHLLKPRERRAELWRQIKFSNAIFRDRVLPMKGSLEVVRQMGYTVEIDDGLQFEGDEPDPGSTSRLVADIVLARLEIERYLTGTHPHTEVISDLLPQTTINQLQAIWSHAAQASTFNGKQEPPLSSQKLLPQPVQVSGATQNLVTAQDDSVHPFHMTELPLNDKTEPVDLTQLDDSMRRACDICGNRAAAVWCHSCDNKQLCDACDDMWHKHPKRLNHQRQSITSLPSPSVSTAAGVNIQGPFGIRAVDSLKHLSTNHRQAPAQDSSPGNVPVLRTNDSSVDPLRNQQMPFDASSSLFQHQQQLQYYHQIQQQQQHFEQMPEYSSNHHPYYTAMIGNTGQPDMQSMMVPASAPKMGQPVVHPAYLLAQNINHPEHTALRRHSGPLQHSVAPPFLPNYMWSGLQQQNLNTVPVQTGRDPLLAATNSSIVGVHYRDLSLRHSGHSNTTLQGPAAGLPAVGTESTSLLGEAGKGGRNMLPRSLPENRLSLISSPLLSRVIAESNYEKRAAKCEIHLMALKEELQEVDDALNALMLNNDDFCELEEFRSLNKRKAMLIREYNTLSQYKQELAKIIDSGVYGACRSDPDMSSEVFHPPTVVSSSNILVKPQTSDLSTPLQSQVDFLQQGTQLSLKKQEQSVYPSHSPQHAALTPGNIRQSDFSQNASPCLENMEENSASGDSRSSVDRRSILPQWKMDPSGLVHGNNSGCGAGLVSTEQQVIMNATPSHQVSSAASNNCVYSTLASQKHQVAIGSNSTEKPTQRDEVLRTVSNLGPSVTQQGTGDFHGDRASTWMAEAKEVGLQSPVTKPKMQSHAEQNIPLSRPGQPLASPSMKMPASQFGRFRPPGDSWQCNHCTLINSPGTRICEACDRTSDNPTLISSHSSSENDLKSGSTQMEGKTELPSADTASAEGKVPDGSIKSMQLEKLHTKLAAEQDRVYLEKKEAQHRYSMMQQAKSEQQQSAPSSHHVDSCIASQPQPHPPVVKKSLQSAAQGTHLSAADNDSGFVSEQLACSAYENKTELCAVARLKENEDRQKVSLESGGSSSSNSSLRSGELSSLSEGNFQQTMERFSEQKKIKQVQIDGAEILHFVKMADRYGFNFTEMSIALEKFGNDSRAALTWLQTEWEKLVDVVVSTVKTEGQRSQHNDVGELSREEAQEALRECGGELVPAVKKCTAKRRAMYARLNPDSTFAREEVLQAMLQCQGDEERARQHLYNTLLQPFLQRVWQGVEEDELGGSAGVGRSLLQMAIAETCQSVSTSVISHEDFQQKVKDKTLDRERRIRMVLVEGKLRSWGRAELVIKLLDHDLPAAYSSQGITNGEDYYCTLEDVVEAVRNCEDKRSALVYLMQECQICFSHYPMSKIRNLNFCQCKICSDCLKQNFEVVIREKHVRHWTCPLCSKPDLNDEELGSEYINFLGMLLQMQVDKEVYDLFETKVRDWHLQKDPHFRWCAHCGNGFIADGGDRHLKMVCPHCSQKTCYQCKKQWEEQHEGVTCEQFAQWKIDNDPNNQAVGLARHLEENGIDCPSCKMRYALAKGGCMHFKCPQCGHEFCSGCYQPFYQRGMCSRLKNCKMNGLHAHHPRDCFFYLRDCDVQHLQVLLRNANVEFNTVPPANQEETSRCPVIEQKEFDSGKRDESCGRDSGDGLAGLCQLHYKEYLVGLINKNNIDPAMSMNIEELRKVLARGEMNVPKQKQNESSAAYQKRISKLVQERMPLPPRSA